MTRFRPILPIPTVKPEIAAFAGFTPKIIPNMKIMIGKNTVDPNPINHCNTLTFLLLSFSIAYSIPDAFKICISSFSVLHSFNFATFSSS